MSSHTIKDRIMLDKFGNQQKEPLKEQEKHQQYKELPPEGIITLPPGDDTTASTTESETTTTTTAGFMGLPKIVWWVVGAGVLYYVAKKQKWIK